MSKTQATFEFDLKRVRNEARSNLDQGPVTPDYPANRDTVLKLLNDALARSSPLTCSHHAAASPRECWRLAPIGRFY